MKNIITILSSSILFIFFVISFMNSCSDITQSEQDSFLTKPCSESWQYRYSMLSLNFSWVLDDTDLSSDHSTTTKETYTVTDKDESSISFNVDDSGSSTALQETQSQFESQCEQTKSLFSKTGSSSYDTSKTISGKSYNCKYLMVNLSKEEALKLNNSELINKATSDTILYKAFFTSKEMFMLSYELSFKIDDTDYSIRKDIVSIN